MSDQTPRTDGELTAAERHESDQLLHAALSGGKLPRWAPAAAGVAAVAVALLLNVVTPVDGVAGTAVVAALLFATIQTVWSFAVEGRRHAVDRLATTAVYTTFIIALVPLVAVLATVVVKGMQIMSSQFLLTSMRNVDPNSFDGGVYHAIVGTLEQVGIAALIGVPLGILTAIYLVEYAPDARSRRLAHLVSFFVDVMTGVPSVVVGLFVYTAFVLTLGMERSGFAASIALMILMLPVVVRSTEEMLRIVPRELREASYALGIPKWRTILKIVLPTAMSGIITGAMLAIARVAGETAPLLLTTFYSNSINWNPFKGPQAALPTYIWDQFTTGTVSAVDRAWGAALVLIVIVMALYLGAKIIARFTGVKRA
ncbi:MAG TPA: phosphate ABC transporter permease PstA [Candidatus Nanopelagicales bacterium]|nr:phosphate ABC transporter permease PstA [Candidatus Nanopelagicales bacterium]